MASTSPDNLRTPEPGDQFNYVNDFVTLANDIQYALNKKVAKAPDPQDISIDRDITTGRDVKADRDVVAGRNVKASGAVTAKTVRVTSTADLSLSSTGHGFQVGPNNGVNLGIDNNEIMARNNGQKSTLGLNWDGGDISLGHASATVNLPGRLNSPHLPYAVATGTVKKHKIVAGGVTNITVTFPAGRFTKAPHVTSAVWGDARDVTAHVDNVSAKQFTLRLGSMSIVDRNIGAQWQAIQM